VTAGSACPTGVSWLRGQGVLAEERGQSIEDHLQACPACQQLHGEIDQLRRSLGRLPATEPAPGWQRSVFARIAEAHQPRGLRRVMRLLPVIAPLMAAAALALVFFARGSGAPAGLSMRFEKGEAAVRSRSEVAAGDAVVVEASGVHTAVAEVRVYRDDAGLVFRCAGDVPAAGCARDGAHMRARLVLPAVGRYRVLLVSAPAALPALSGSFDADVGVMAGVPGASFQQADAFDVW
jgi:hypothetical protein